jgi:type I restriction enzyme, S subunit
MVPLGAVLDERKDRPADEDVLLGVYPVVSKISFETGKIHFRPGAETKTGMILVQLGDLLVSGINAYKGAVAIYEGTGPAVATIHYGAYRIRPEVAGTRFLWWLLRSHRFQDLLEEHVPGGIKTELKAKRLLPIPIPLPPLAEQRRVVERIEALAAKVEEAKRLRAETILEAESLSPNFLGSFFRELSKSHPPIPLGDLCSIITDGPHITPSYVPHGVPFVTVRNMVTGRLDLTGLQFVTVEDHREFVKRCKPERGDVLYSKDGATRGRPCYVDTDKEFSIFVSVALIKPLRDRLDGQYLCHVLNSTMIKDRMSDKSRGDMIPHIVLREIRSFPIPAPPLSEQHLIRSSLDMTKDKTHELKTCQRQCSEELAALLPAVLDRAFRGEL